MLGPEFSVYVDCAASREFGAYSTLILGDSHFAHLTLRALGPAPPRQPVARSTKSWDGIFKLPFWTGFRAR